MKVVIAVMSYYPHEGGVQMVTKYLAEGLAEKGHEIIVLTASSPGDVREESYHKVLIKRYDVGSLMKIVPTGETEDFKNALLEECQNADAFVNVCGNTPLAVLVYQVIDKIPCKKVLHQHGMFDGRFHFRQCHTVKEIIKMMFTSPLWELFHRYYWNKMTQFDDCIHLFEHDSSHQYFIAHGYHHNHVVMNSCESTFFEGQTDKTVLDKYHINRPYYIYVGNYCKRKDQIRAAKTYLASDCKAMDLVLVGSTPNSYYSKLQSILATSSHQGRIHLLSSIPRQDTIDLIKNSYACLMTSNYEYFPISIIEAMACGKPFVSTDVGVVKDIPGGKVCRSDKELIYWLRYFEENPFFVSKTGSVARAYARERCYLPDVINQVETICNPNINR